MELASASHASLPPQSRLTRLTFVPLKRPGRGIHRRGTLYLWIEQPQGGIDGREVDQHGVQLGPGVLDPPGDLCALAG